MLSRETLSMAAGDAVLARSDELADLITDRQYELQPDLPERFGERGRVKTRQDTLYNLRYLSQSAQIESPLLFASYITWLRILLAGYRVTSDDLRVNLACMRDVLKEKLDPEHAPVLDPYLEQALLQLGSPLEIPPSFLAESELREDAERYVELLLRGDRAGAGELILELVKKGVPVEDVYMHIFQQAQYEIGRLWQTNEITVAQEHYFTAATQSIMSQLYPYIFASARKGHRLVAACVGEELHEIGLRMVSDIFELNGWDTYYVGANVPARSLIRSLIEREADVLAISVTMTFHVGLVRGLIADIRSNEHCSGVKIIVGGMPFNIDRQLWRQVGADGYAPDARSALQQAYTLLGNRAAGE